MNFFLLEFSTNKNEVGTYPQTEGYYPGYNIHGANSMINLKSDSLPNFLPDLRFLLNTKAKVTDIIKAGNISRANGLFINQKTKEIFEKYSMPDHGIYEGFLETNGNIYVYFWLHLIDQSLSNIDFDKSIFYTTKLGFKKDSEIKLLNEIDLKNKLKDLGQLILAEKISLTIEFKEFKYDIFQFPLIQRFNTFFISERLADSLTKNKVTGIEIKGQDIIE